MPIDHATHAEIQSDIHRVEAILGSGIFNPENVRHPLFPSAVTELVIRVRDLLAKAEKYSQRVDFADDVTIKGKVNDVTGLITYIRDAVCHVDSGKHDHDEINARISFNAAFGKGCLIQYGDTKIESQYEDDIAFFFGAQRLYMQRHLVRAYREAVTNLRPHIESWA